MADEVTKKDLQSLQGYCNKQIADVNKRIDNAKIAVNDLAKDVETNNSTLTDAINNSDQVRRASVDQLKAAISALETRVAALEK